MCFSLRGAYSSNDSVSISYSDLRKANSKLIELEFEQQKNSMLKDMITVDSILIETQNNLINQLRTENENVNKRLNLSYLGFGLSLTILILVSIFK